MRIIVRAFGPISEKLGRQRIVELPIGSTLEDLAEKLRKETTERVPSLLVSDLKIIVNGALSTNGEQILKEGDRVDILSPFAGG